MPRIFVCYSRQDSRWVRPADPSERALVPWLAQSLADLGVEMWVDAELDRTAGADFEKVICDEIDRSEFALLFLSQDFITSQFIRRVELPRIRARMERGEMQIIPILAAPINWEWNDEARWLHTLQIIPPKPLTEYLHNESEWRRVRLDVLTAIHDLVAPRTQSPNRSRPAAAPEAPPHQPEPMALPPARPGESSDEHIAALREAEAKLAAAKARQVKRMTVRAAREREAEVLKQIAAIEEEERRLGEAIAASEAARNSAPQPDVTGTGEDASTESLMNVDPSKLTYIMRFGDAPPHLRVELELLLSTLNMLNGGSPLELDREEPISIIREPAEVET